MLTDVSEVRTASITALMMEAVRTSETSINSKLHTRRRENLKSDMLRRNIIFAIKTHQE
jgi:hypothetical protein